MASFLLLEKGWRAAHLRFSILSVFLSLSFSALMAFGGPAVFLDNDGTDSRTLMTLHSRPWSSIGLVRYEYGEWLNSCTGSLVGGRVMLTAAHCVLESGAVMPVHFLLNYINGVYAEDLKSVVIRVGTLDYAAHPEEDWAVVVLDRNVTKKYGHFGFVPPQRIKVPMEVTFVGYSDNMGNGGETATIDDCDIQNRFPKSYFGHDCSMSEGASGGPLFYGLNGHYYIVGINTFEQSHETYAPKSYSPKISNKSVWSEKLYKTLVEFRKKYP